MTNFVELPMELLVKILEYISYDDLLSISLVCRYLFQVSQDERVWRSLCFTQFNCKQHISGALQRRESIKAISLESLPLLLRKHITSDAIGAVSDAGIIFDSMKNHFHRVRALHCKKTFLQRTIFQVALEATFGYEVHSMYEWVGRKLIAAIEHCDCEWSDSLLERVLDHSKIPDLWKSILLCKIFWTCCPSQNSELDSFISPKKRNISHPEVTYGNPRLASLLEKVINQKSWNDTSELLLDTLLILGAIPSRTCIKRALQAPCKSIEAIEKFKKIFPKLIFALNYATDSKIDDDEKLYLTETLQKCEVEYGQSGELYHPIHAAASRRNIEVLNILITDFGLDINQRTTNEATALSILVSSTLPRLQSNRNRTLEEETKLCVDMGAKVDSVVLQAALQKGQWKISEVLVKEYNADCCVIFLDSNEQVQTPLQLALNANQLDCAILFLELGGDIFSLDNFEWISNSRSLEFFNLCNMKLIDWNNILDNAGNTIVHALACGSYTYPIEFLSILQKVNLSTQNYLGETPLQTLINNITSSTSLALMSGLILPGYMLSISFDEPNVAKELLENTLKEWFSSSENAPTIMKFKSEAGLTLHDQAIAASHNELLGLFQLMDNDR